MVYLPTCSININPNVGKYAIHGSYGKYTHFTSRRVTQTWKHPATSWAFFGLVLWWWDGEAPHGTKSGKGLTGHWTPKISQENTWVPIFVDFIWKLFWTITTMGKKGKSLPWMLTCNNLQFDIGPWHQRPSSAQIWVNFLVDRWTNRCKLRVESIWIPV